MVELATDDAVAGGTPPVGRVARALELEHAAVEGLDGQRVLVRVDLEIRGRLAAGRDLDGLTRQVVRYRPRLVSVADERDLPALIEKLRSSGVERFPQIVFGDEGLVAVACLDGVDTVVSATVGAVGFLPTYRALAMGRRVCLANGGMSGLRTGRVPLVSPLAAAIPHVRLDAADHPGPRLADLAGVPSGEALLSRRPVHLLQLLVRDLEKVAKRRVHSSPLPASRRAHGEARAGRSGIVIGQLNSHDLALIASY